MMFGQQPNTQNIQVTSKGSDQTAQGCSEPLLVAHTTLLELKSNVLRAGFDCAYVQFVICQSITA